MRRAQRLRQNAVQGARQTGCLLPASAPLPNKHALPCATAVGGRMNACSLTRRAAGLGPCRRTLGQRPLGDHHHHGEKAGTASMHACVRAASSSHTTHPSLFA